jgi:hypothetical protein
MRLTSPTIVFYSILAVFCVAWAGSKDQEPFTIIGIARNSCGNFLEALDGERKARPPNADPDGIYTQRYGGYLDFADGFLTGANYADNPPNRMIGQGNDHAGRMAWLENYCRRYPLISYGSALYALRKQLESH